MKFIVILVGLLLLMTWHPLMSRGQLRPAQIIGDGMVMQRGEAVPVWGWAAPGDEVTVAFDQQSYTTEADASGQWMVFLPAMPAGGPHEMSIAAPDTVHRVRDILVGDVWICSGQSNMEWVVADAHDAVAEIAAAQDLQIRHYKVPRSWAFEPEATLAGGDWETADPAHVADFTAVGYFFARALREHVDVPVGLINSTWGGSRIEPWMSASALGLDGTQVAALVERVQDADRNVLDVMRARFGMLPEQDVGLVEGDAVWAEPRLDDADWQPIPVPSTWEESGYPGMDGIGWYRTTVDLTEEEAHAGARLGLGTIDDSDITWVNGHEVGRTEMAWNRPRLYHVPPAALRPGRNVIAVRVEDTGGGGGIYGDSSLVYLEVGGARRALDQTWRFKPGAVSVSLDSDKNQVSTLLYNKMIFPLLSYPIKGVLWYQGESNAGSTADAVAYRTLFADLIESWRGDWGQGDFPFLWVQLAGYMATDVEPPRQSNWALLRESQASALELPGTGQAVIVDLGEADDIHPRNKQDVGARLALAVRKVAYGEDIVYAGPAYRGYEIEKSRVILAFDHVGGGLVAGGHDENVGGFAIAGPDRRFVWAEARIEGDRVVVWSDRVAEPVAVRYAWANNPEHANLYSREGLPAAPFRTDSW